MIKSQERKDNNCPKVYKLFGPTSIVDGDSKRENSKIIKTGVRKVIDSVRVKIEKLGKKMLDGVIKVVKT